MGIGRSVFVLINTAILTGGVNGIEKHDGKAAGENSGLWWMQQTALNRGGHLAVDLKGRSWWPQAESLKLSESVLLDVSGAPNSSMLVRRERFQTRSGEWVEGIVWVIDDDEDGSVRSGGDTDSDCYIVDYGGDGTIDRMVDYIDNDGDNDPDEMDIRYFIDGGLRNAWFGFDLDDDSSMWSLTGYEYGGPSFFESDPYGNSMIFKNKFNPNRGTWVPISECPFAFYDTDGDGYSEVVVRVSAVPLDYDPDVYPDYANNQSFVAWSEEQERIGAVNIRCSFDVDNLSSEAMPLHYEFGFNLVGAVPYKFPGMEHWNEKRRPPQVTQVIPYDRLRAISDSYEARETGFSWCEHSDDTISIGYGPEKDQDFRWEGVFWIWERRFMENTGAPTQKWNVRREWSPQPARERELYYSGVDRRIHLKNAQEGWMEIGHFAGLGPIGEIRMLDSDQNGYFDRWEVYMASDTTPVRVTTVKDEKVQTLPFDSEWISKFFVQDLLPEAMSANVQLLAALNSAHPVALPSGLRSAMEKGSPNRMRFAQDVAKELHYQELRRYFAGLASAVLRNAEPDDLYERTRSRPNSETAWQLLRLVQDLDVAYGKGDYDRAIEILDQLGGQRPIFEKVD